MLALVWSIALGLVAGLAYIINLDAKVSALLDLHHQDRNTLMLHISESGHPVALERTEGLIRRVEKLEQNIK